MVPELIYLPPTAHQKAIARRKLAVGFISYWMLLMGLVYASATFGGSSIHVTILLALWLGAWSYLLIAVSDGAARAGRSSITWGGGIVLLGPLSALVLPVVLLMQLRE